MKIQAADALDKRVKWAFFSASFAAGKNRFFATSAAATVVPKKLLGEAAKKVRKRLESAGRISLSSLGSGRWTLPPQDLLIPWHVTTESGDETMACFKGTVL